MLSEQTEVGFFVVALVFTHSVIVENYFLFRIFTFSSGN